MNVYRADRENNNHKTMIIRLDGMIETLNDAVERGQIDQVQKTSRLKDLLFEIKWSCSPATIQEAELKISAEGSS